MATIGQQLTVPESTWRRYDDINLTTKLTGTWNRGTWTNVWFYNNTALYSGILGSKLFFKFKGTKLLLSCYCNADQSGFNLKIDGIDRGNISLTTAYARSAVCFIDNSLSDTIHDVEITLLSNTITGGTNPGIMLDFIDIDSTGYLVHPMLNQVNNINDIKNIGDCIPQKYMAITSGQVGVFSELGTTIAPLIPAASSATPDGSFYWVYVGKDYLGRKKFIADRNIQHSISWDALNSAGICSEKIIDLFFTDNIITPVIGGSSDGRVTYSTQTVANSATYAFDNSDNSGWISNAATGWIAYDFGVGKTIKKYNIVVPDWGGFTQCPKNWTLEGSNDNGVNWSILDARIGITWSGTGSQNKDFYINTPGNYKRYRLNISLNNGHSSSVSVYELKLFESVNNQYAITLRLPTGGISTSDTDNEWDKIIVGSTLGGKITPGDNNVWNWNQSLSPWTSTSSSSANRSIRSTNNNISNWNGAVSTEGTTVNQIYRGFRPVLLIEQLIFDKYLIKKDSNYYSILPAYYDAVSHEFLPLILSGGDKPNKADIDAFGFDNLNLLLKSIVKGGDTINPIIKLGNNINIKIYTVT